MDEARMRDLAEVVASLRGEGVPCLLIGAAAINLYATEPGMVVHTEDADLLLPPETATLTRALATLQRDGFELWLGGEPFPNSCPDDLPNLVATRSCVRAVRGETRLDLVLDAAGVHYADAWARGREFEVDGVSIRAAPLADLIESKRLANRPKDRAFLESWKFAVEEEREREARRREREGGGPG